MFNRRDEPLPHVEIEPIGVERGRCSEVLSQGVRGRQRVAGLILVSAALLVVDQNPLHVVGAGAKVNVVIVLRGAEDKAALLAGRRVWADEVARQSAQVMKEHAGLLVVVGVEGNAALLPEHAAEVVGRIEGVSGKISFHNLFASGFGVWRDSAGWRQVTAMIPTSIPAGVYWFSRALRLAWRWGWNKS